jgi:hypothetical protein
LESPLQSNLRGCCSQEVQASAHILPPNANPGNRAGVKIR